VIEMTRYKQALTHRTSVTIHLTPQQLQPRLEPTLQASELLHSDRAAPPMISLMKQAPQAQMLRPHKQLLRKLETMHPAMLTSLCTTPGAQSKTTITTS